MTIDFLPDDPPDDFQLEALRRHAASVLEPVAARFAALPRPDHVVGSSKAIRSLAKLAGYPVPGRSEERRVGNEFVSTCRYRWSPYHLKTNIQNHNLNPNI